MFILKKIVTAFILPPGIFIVALAGMAVWLRKRNRAGSRICTGLAAIMWICSCNMVSDVLNRPLEYAYSAPAAPAGDVIIVLGGGAYNNDEIFSAGERLQPASLERESAAALVQKKTGLPVIVSGGAVFSDMPEAEASAKYLIELGVPANSVITEDQSRDTMENARFSRKLCVKKGYKKIILLTSASHMPRAVYSFKKAGFADIVPFPVSRTVQKKVKLYYHDLLPLSLNGVAHALNEYIGLLYYRLL